MISFDFKKYWGAFEVKDWQLYQEFVREIIDIESKANEAEFYRERLLRDEKSRTNPTQAAEKKGGE